MSTHTKPQVRPTTQDGSLPHQRPISIIDAQTNKSIDEDEFNQTSLIPLMEFVREETKRLVTNKKDDIVQAIGTADVKQPVGVAWKNGIRPEMSLPEGQKVLSTSRIERLVLHRTISEMTSYLNSENPLKQEPTYDALKVTLGAVDKQMATMTFSSELRQMFLRWKCWNREVIIAFDMPEFMEGYRISKFCLPTVRYDEDRTCVMYDLPFVESLDYSDSEFHHCYGGVDLGRVEPFVLSFKNAKGKLIATFHASGRLRQLNDKRERLIREKKCVVRRRANLLGKGVVSEGSERIRRLDENIEGLAAKIKGEGKAIAALVGREVAECCSRVGASVVGVEDLRWVSGEHGSSRWNFRDQQGWIAREVHRVGVAYMEVNPRNSSRLCSVCGSKRTSYDSQTRVVSCQVCHAKVDRDVGASRVLAGRCCARYVRYVGKIAVGRLREAARLRC